MVDAPERIWSNPTGSMSVEYVRADLYAQVERERDAAREYGLKSRHRENLAEDARIHQRDRASALEVELEQVKRERADAKQALQNEIVAHGNTIRGKSERLAGARVKALPRPDTVSMSGGAICLEYADYDLRDAAYDWLEAHGAGGELEPHPRATNTVGAHETANVSDNALAEPAGEAEPVGYLVRGFDGGPFFAEDREQYDRQGHAVVPVYTTPPDASAIREALEAIRALSGLDGELCKASATIMSRMADIHQTADAALAGAKP